MAEKTAEKFINALAELEANSDVEKIAALFADDCEIGNVVMAENSHAVKGAREFWTNYRGTFGKVKSEFRNKIYSDGKAALEWTTTGTNTDGQQIKYDGVSVLETDGEKITRFFAYFNPSDLGHQISE
ncbi:MAG: nuclear transport factor 2 family protein [Pyrinomonadaceae bacterium]